MRYAVLGGIDIRRVINDKAVVAHFQQVVSVARKTVSGVEGLIRGLAGGTMVPPGVLFDAATKRKQTLDFDRLCRDKVLEAFAAVYAQNKDKLLFLNLDASVLDTAAGSRHLIGQVARSGIAPRNIVLEINETKVTDNDKLKSFIDRYRNAGFLIALDDVGAGFSNLDRIPVAKPDIIKVDIGLIRHIHCDYHKQEVVKSLIRLSAQIGAMVVAEGVETEEEAMETMRLGVHMIQGFLFSKPSPLEPGRFENARIEQIGSRFKDYMSAAIRQKQEACQQMMRVARQALAVLADADDFDRALMGIVRCYDCVECAYILDEAGIQCSDTVFAGGARENLIFYSAEKGADHSMKRYYYHLVRSERTQYMTEPYVSLATGNLCVTYAQTFKAAEGKNYILCLDFLSFAAVSK